MCCLSRFLFLEVWYGSIGITNITGHILVTGPRHNPEYLRWRRERNLPIARTEEPCTIPSLTLLENQCTIFNVPDEFTHDLIEYARVVNRVQRYEIPDLPNQLDPDLTADLRLKYLLKELTVDQFKTKLQQKNKKNLKNIANRQVYETFVAAAIDQLFDFLILSDQDWEEDCTRLKESFEMMRTLSEFCQASFNRIAEKFGAVRVTLDTPTFDP